MCHTLCKMLVAVQKKEVSYEKHEVILIFVVFCHLKRLYLKFESALPNLVSKNFLQLRIPYSMPYVIVVCSM